MNDKVKRAISAYEKKNYSYETKNKKVSEALDLYEKRRKYTAEDELKKLSEQLASEIETYNTSINSPVEHGYGTNATKNVLDSQRQSSINISKLRNQIEAYRDIIGNSDADKMISSLDSMKKGYQAQVDWASQFSQWETEDDYNKAVESQKNRDEMLSFDIEAGRKEIDNLKSISDKISKASKGKSKLEYNDYYGAYKRAGYSDEQAKELANNAVNSNSANDSKIDSEIAKYLEGTGYNSAQELDDAISQKTSYYNRAKVLQEGESLKNNAINSPDFEEYSKKGADIVNPTMREAEGYAYIFGWRPGAEDVGNIVTYSRDNYEDIRMGEANRSEMVGSSKYHYMNDDEVSVYNYYLAKENSGQLEKGTAQKYLDSLEDTLNQREAGNMYERMEDNTALELTFGITAGFDQFSSGIKNLFNTEDNYIAPSSIQYASGMVREDLADAGANLPEWMGGGSIGQAGYDLITTTSNMMPSILASSIVGMINPVAGEAAGAVLMGASASGNAYQEMLNLGYDKSQARVYSALTGVSEAGLQYALGGIGKLGGKLSENITSKAIESIAKGINNASAQFAIKYGGKFLAEMGSEGLEEFLQDVLDPFFKSFATGETPEGIDWEQAAYSGFLGALSAGILNGAGSVENKVAEVSKANKIIREGNVKTLKNVGKTFDAETIAYKLADKVTDKTGAWKLSQLLHEVNATLGEQTQADIKNALIEKGITETDAESISKWLAKAVDGYTLTKSQQKALDENPVISRVFKKVIIDSNSTVNQRIRGVMDVNGIEGTSGVDLTQIHRDYTEDKIITRTNLEQKLKSIATENAKRKFGIGQTLSRESNAMIDSMVDDAVKQYGAKAENKISKTEASIRDDGRVSDTGKTILISTGEEVNIRKINSIDAKNKELTFELDNGKIVSNKDIQYANNDIALAYESMVNLGYDLDTANAMVQILSTNSVKPNNQLLRGLNKAYEYGWGHFPESARTDADFNSLTETQKDTAIKLGQDARVADDKARESRIPAGQKANAKKSSGKEFGATLESYGTKVPKRVQVSVDALDAIGKKLQTKFIVRDLKGQSNGYYSESENAFVIDINAGLKGQYTLLWTASHELVHYFRRWSPSDFTALADFLMQRYADSGKNIDELIAIEQDKAFRATKGKDVMSFDAAYEEVVAQAMQEFLTNSNFIEELSDLQKSNPGLVQKIIDTLRKILEDVREWYKGLTPSDKATAYVKEMGEAANEMYDMLSKGLLKASETSMAKVENSVANESKISTAEMQNEAIKSVADVATDTDGNPLFNQYKAMEADEEKYRTMLTKHGLMSNDQIDYLFKTVDMALEKIKSNLEALDYAWETDIDERGFNPIKPNSDPLYKVSLDFSTLCRKRILQQVIQAQLQEALNTQLTREEGIAIRNELMQIQEEGRQIEIACALCYVESARMKSNAQIKKFLKNRDQIIKEFFAGTNPGEVKQKIKDAEVSKRQELAKRFKNDDIATMSLKDITKEYGGRVAQEIRDAKKAVKGQYVPTAEEQKLIDKAKTMSISDFTTPEGLENLVKNYPRLFDAYTSFIRNATKSKGIENDTWWRAGDSYSVDKNGEPVLTNALVDAMNRENGLRSQSWSDFQVIHILDYMAAIIELSTRNAKMQTYTKVADLVHLMGNTNLMLNLSLIPARTFNGKLEFDSVEGMMFKTALELRDKYHATAGTISIGINDEQIRMLLESELIDYVIPYHKSGMSSAIRKLMHIPTWDEYEKYQNESFLNGGNAEENAKKYGVKLNTNKDIWHKTPNFSDWFDIEIANQITKMENANPSNKAEAKKYGVMYGAYKAMQNAAEEYKKVCAERGLAPKFEQFLDEANYWKLLIDRKMIDNITGEIIEQKAVTPQFDRGEVMRILDDEVARYPKVKADQDYAINEVVKRFLSKDFKSESNKNLKLSEDTETALSESINGISKVNILSSVQDTYSLISEDMSNAVQAIVQELGTSDETLVEAEVSDVVNTTDIKNQYKNEDETYSKIGKEMLGYQEGNRKPDLTLVEVYNDRTGKTETTIKFVGDKPKGYIPQKIAYCYKLFEQHPDGTLHALFAGASNATPIGEWVYSQGFPYTDSGVKGMNLRERYGWHLSAGLPSAPHLMSTKDFNRGYPSKAAYGHPKGSKRVWVRMAYDASTDFNSIADSTKAGDIFGLIPFGGYYAFKENNQSEWVISSAVKIDKILNEEERQQILKDAGYDEYEAWRKKHRPTEAEKLANKRKSAENKKAKDKAIKAGLNYLSENSKAMRESIKSRIIDNPELSGVKNQYKVTAEQDAEYLELAKNPKKNEARLREMLDEAAKKAGYPERVLHGTQKFGFTKTDTSLSDDKLSFFATSDVETAKSYSSLPGKRGIFEDVNYEDIDSEIELHEENARDGAYELADAISKWAGYYGAADSDYIYDEFSRIAERGDFASNTGTADGDMYEIAEDIIANLYDEDMHDGMEFYEWQESEEAEELYTKVNNTIAKFLSKTEFEQRAESSGNYDLYANTDGMLVIDGNGAKWDKLNSPLLPDITSEEYSEYGYRGHWKDWTTRSIAKYASDNGYSGVVFKNIVDDGGKSSSKVTKPADVYAFFNPKSQVKSADLVTYDDNGNIIPLSERFRTDRTGEDAWKNDDIRYQYRDTNATDNRTLLSNAFASTAQNEIEKKYIEQYQEKIDTINSEQKKLTELRAKIKELSFAKGHRDAEQIRKLQDEATKTANRINTFDKQLLKLESAKPLKEVLKREKALAKKKAEKAGREALDAYKERAAKTQRELMDRYQERIKKGKESRDKTELRHKILKKVKELNNLLLKGDKDHHVPLALQKSTALALQAINMDTVNADERIAKIREKMAKSNNPEQIEKWQKSIDRIELQGENMMAKLDALDRAYEDIKNSSDPLIANVYDDGIKQAIVNLKNEVGDTPLREMSLNQLESVYDMYKMVLHTIRNANKSFKAEKQETITELGNNVMQEVESIGGKKKYTVKALDFFKKFAWLNLKPVYAMKAIGSNTLSKLFDNVRAGEDTWAVDVNEAREYFLDKAKKYNYNEWDFDQRYTFKSKTGKEFSLSLQEIMSLYAYSKREQADLHLTMGGFVFDDATEIVEKKKGIPVKYTVNIADAHNISIETLSDIINTLTPEQQAFVNEMQKYLADDMGAKGNEVSRIMYDIDLFKDKNYFPLKSAKQFMFEQNEVAGEVRIKNSGFTKGTVPKANNPIILKGFMDVWSEHVSDMAMYHSFVLPLEDFNRVFNYKTPTSDNIDTESVKMAIQNAYGRQANDYIKQMLTDLNGGARSQQGAEITNKLISLFKKGAVFASASVVIQQPSAIARAMAYIDAKYFAEATPSAWNLKKHSSDWAEVKKYAPVAIIKEMGYFDTNMGKQTTDWITSMEYDGFGEKAKALVTDSGFRDEMLSKAPALADEIAWVHIWNAVKKEVADTNKTLVVGSEDFLKECGKRFTEVVVNTQVYDSVLSRSALMRSKDTGVKMATAFMAEPTTSINMIADALIQGKRGNKKFARKAIGAVIAQMILNSILVSLVYAGRDDDDDKTYAEKYIGTLVGTTLDSINPLGLIPYVKDIVSIVQGYDVERSDMAVISGLWNAYQNLGKDSVSPYKKVEDFAGAIANLFGLPLKNIMRDARTCYNIVNSFINGDGTTAEGIKRSIIEEITGDDANKQMKNELIDAMESGDSAKIKKAVQELLDSGKDKSAIQSSLTSYWKPLFLEAYRNNDNAEMAKIRKALNSTGIYKDVVKTTQNWIKESK